MQRLFSLKQLGSNFHKNPSPSITSFSKSFTSLTKPTQQNPFSSSICKHPFQSTLSWRSQYTLPYKTHAFFSNPLIGQRVLLYLRNLSKTFMDGKLWFLRAQFPKRSFDPFQNFGSSYRRGWRSWFQRLTENDVVLGLIIANAAVFFLWRIADRRFMVENFTISVDNFVHGRLHTLITSAFSHSDLEHIASNMIGLYFFGTNIARIFGPEYLLKLYLVGALGGSLFYLAHHAFLSLSSKGQTMWRMDPSRIPGLGASGAVNAIMLLDIFLNPRATLYFDFIIPVPAMLLGIFLIGKDMLRIIEGNSNISGSAHLGGAAVAALAWYRIKRGRF